MVRITTHWEGFPGAPGFTNFYAASTGSNEATVADAFGDDIHAFWTAISNYIPASATLTVGPDWEHLNDASGALLGAGTLSSPPAAVDGTSAANYAGNAGVAINWSTDVFIAGRRLKGRTYVVPSAGSMDADGTLEATARAAITTAASDLAVVGNSSVLVWHRPVNGAGGSSSRIIGVQISDRAARLGSRSV